VRCRVWRLGYVLFRILSFGRINQSKVSVFWCFWKGAVIFPYFVFSRSRQSRISVFRIFRKGAVNIRICFSRSIRSDVPVFPCFHERFSIIRIFRLGRQMPFFLSPYFPEKTEFRFSRPFGLLCSTIYRVIPKTAQARLKPMALPPPFRVAMLYIDHQVTGDFPWQFLLKMSRAGVLQRRVEVHGRWPVTARPLPNLKRKAQLRFASQHGPANHWLVPPARCCATASWIRHLRTLRHLQWRRPCQKLASVFFGLPEPSPEL
jgi:hypothetical protein